MITPGKYKALIWTVIILVTLNLATLLSLYFHTHQSTILANESQEEVSKDSVARGAIFLGKQLGLNMDQMESFREIHREYNRSANQITRNLELLRLEMIRELGQQQPDIKKINQTNHEFGKLHEELKNQTATYYLELKKICTPEQQEQLQEIFETIAQPPLKNNEWQGRRRGRGWNNNQ